MTAALLVEHELLTSEISRMILSEADRYAFVVVDQLLGAALIHHLVEVGWA